MDQLKHPPTGGGPPPKDLNPIEEMWLQMTSDSAAVDGISGGIDTSSTAADEEDQSQVVTGVA